jgi:hypothetical protein
MLSTTPVFDLAGVRNGWLSKTSLLEAEYMSMARHCRSRLFVINDKPARSDCAVV